MSLKSEGIFKKFSGVFLLLFIVTAVFIPLGAAKAGVLGDLVSFDIFSSLTEWTAKLVAGDSTFMTTIYWLAYRIISLGLYLTTVLVYFGAWLVDVFLDENIYRSVLNMNDTTSAVYIGWTTVRDACNTFFILFLLLIAFSTILRIQTYNAKSLLPKLIISLFLINFSATIAMMVIDFGQVFMFEIKEWMGAGGFSEAGSPLTTIVDYFHNEYGWHKPPPSEEYLMSDVVGVMFAVAYSAILGLLYIMLALFLMVRIVVFVILVIISPFAFFSIILPGMRTYTSQWWQSLVSHAIFGPVFLFFIFLAGKMAQSMQTFDSPVPEPEDISALTYIIAKLIPHVVALGMLMAAIPVTQKLGVAGSSKIIGGAAGLGKVGIGAVAAAKLAGGAGKKVGGGTVGRAHSGLKGGALGEGVAKRYNKATEKVSGAIKSLPIVGRISIEHEAGKAEQKKEAISKHEKILESRTDKDKKKYVDSFKLDKNKQAEAKQAMFNVLAKDNGAGLTNKNLQKMGYEKEVAGKKVFDEEKFNKDYGQVVAHGHDTSKIETYRPDLINDKKDRLEKIDKIAANGDEKNIKLATLADPEMDARLRKEIGNTRYNNLINSKSQAEKDDLAEIKENQVVKGLTIASVNKKDKDALDITSDEGKEELLRQQTDIAYLSGGKDKAEKMNKIKGVKMDKKKGHFVLDYEKDASGKDIIDKDIAYDVVNRMNTDELVDQNPQFLEDTTYMIKDPEQFRRINRNKDIKTEQTEAIRNSIDKRWTTLDKKARTADEDKEYDRLEKAGDIMGSSITSSSGGGGSSPIAHSEPKSRQSASGDGSVSDQEDSSTASYQRTKDELGELAKSGGFNQGIEISGKLGMSAPREENGKLLMGSKTVDNLREAFEADKKFAEGGTGDMIKHEEQHTEGPALKSSQKMADELKKYSEQDGVSSEDIENKETELYKKYYEGLGHTEQTEKLEKEDLKEYIEKNKGASDEDIKKKAGELHEKYTDYRGYEMQTEVQRINEALKKDPEGFVKNEARMHVMTDVAYEGIDKMGEIEYGPENSGLHRTHSAFIKEDVEKDITKEMETMRQDLVAKHNAKKDAENEQPSDSGDDATVEGGDDFMTGGGKSGIGEKTTTDKKTEAKPREKKTEAGKVVDKTPVSDNGIGEDVETKPQTKVEKIKKVAGAVNKVASRMDMKRVAGRRGKDPVEETKMAMKVVDVGSKLDKRIAMIKPVADVLLEEQLKIDEERQGGKEISQWQEDKRKFVALKNSVGKIIPKDSKNDGKYIGRAGAALSEVGKNVGGTKGAVLEKAGKVLQNEKAQKVISEEARSRIAKEDEKPKAQKPDTETAKQPKLKQKDSKTEKTETKPEIEERIIETKESISKGGLKSSVVKSEITFDPTKFSAEWEEQMKEAMKGVNNGMLQKVTNEIEVNSSQEAMDIDFEKIIDPDKVIKLVEKGINIKGVEKNLKDVKKSLEEFKGNNNKSSSTTVFGAGVSAAEEALKETLTIKDRKERNVKLATIAQVMNEIELEMDKQNKSSVKGMSSEKK